jgi:hypothetical protein
VIISFDFQAAANWVVINAVALFRALGNRMGRIFTDF